MGQIYHHNEFRDKFMKFGIEEKGLVEIYQAFCKSQERIYNLDNDFDLMSDVLLSIRLNDNLSDIVLAVLDFFIKDVIVKRNMVHEQMREIMNVMGIVYGPDYFEDKVDIFNDIGELTKQLEQILSFNKVLGPVAKEWGLG